MREDDISKVLKDIYARVPKEWRHNAVTESFIAPTTMKVIDEALISDDFPAEKKPALQMLKDNGYLDKKKYTDNPQIIKKIDNFVNREIKKAVQEGRLPNKKKLAELKEIWKQQKENLSKV